MGCTHTHVLITLKGTLVMFNFGETVIIDRVYVNFGLNSAVRCGGGGMGGLNIGICSRFFFFFFFNEFMYICSNKKHSKFLSCVDFVVSNPLDFVPYLPPFRKKKGKKNILLKSIIS